MVTKKSNIDLDENVSAREPLDGDFGILWPFQDGRFQDKYDWVKPLKPWQPLLAEPNPETPWGYLLSAHWEKSWQCCLTSGNADSTRFLHFASLNLEKFDILARCFSVVGDVGHPRGGQQERGNMLVKERGGRMWVDKCHKAWHGKTRHLQLHLSEIRNPTGRDWMIFHCFDPSSHG